MSKTEYAYTTGNVGAATKVYNYTYGNTWKDQLTAFDGSTITYDASGNPLNYLGKTLTWSRGRLLTKYVSGSKTVDMQYDAKGIRIGKTRKVVSTTTNCTYIYDNGGKLRTEIDGNTTRNYIYGQDGVVGYEENGVHFMYRKNFFGDITAIYQGATKIAEYAYDAWGNCTIVSDYNGYGARNPFRYRGYYFDSDLGMYYLTTRYYDPNTGRFINADTIEYLKPDKINGLNLYAYCGNNPVMRFDPSGHESESFWEWLLSILIWFCNNALSERPANQIAQNQTTEKQIEIVTSGAEKVYDACVDYYERETQSQLVAANAPREAAQYIDESIKKEWNEFIVILKQNATPDNIADATQSLVGSAGNGDKIIDKMFDEIGYCCIE